MELELAAHMFPSLAVLESVRCLECGDIYAKPPAGCPACGYLGWIPVSLPPERESPIHSASGRPRLRLVPRR
jgi:hypothetical protein